MQSHKPRASACHEVNHHTPLPSVPSITRPQPHYPSNYFTAGQVSHHPLNPAYTDAGRVANPAHSSQGTQPPCYPQSSNGARPGSQSTSQEYKHWMAILQQESAGTTSQQPSSHTTINHNVLAGRVPGHPPSRYPPPPHLAWPYPMTYPRSYSPLYGDQQQQRKITRAAHACHSCRQKKTKCDEGRPECTHCRKNGLECDYGDNPPPKSDIQAIHGKVDAIGGKMDLVLDRLKSLEDGLSQLATIVESLVTAHTSYAQSVKSTDMVRIHSLLPTQETSVNQNCTFTGANKIKTPFMYSFTSQGTAMQAPIVLDDNSTTRGLIADSDLHIWPATKAQILHNFTFLFVTDGEVARVFSRRYDCDVVEQRANRYESISHRSVRSSVDYIGKEDTLSPSSVTASEQLIPRDPKLNAVFDHAKGSTPEGGLRLSSKLVDAGCKGSLQCMRIPHLSIGMRVSRSLAHPLEISYSFGDAIDPRLPPRVGLKRKRDAYELVGSTQEEVSSDSIPPDAIMTPRFRDPQLNRAAQSGTDHASVLQQSGLGIGTQSRFPWYIRWVFPRIRSE